MSTSHRRQPPWTALVSVLQYSLLPLLFTASLLSAAENSRKYIESQLTTEINLSKSKNYSDEQQENFLQKLLQDVLGIEHASQDNKKTRPHTYPPPQYMLDLYKAVASSSGVTLTPNPYYANVVRSYLDRDSSHNQRFFFNVSSNNRSKRDRILEAEFHLYKLKPRLRAKTKIKQLKSQLLEIRLYQVMPKKKNKNQKKSHHRLLDSRRVSVRSTGWEIFYVKDAVTDWIKNNNTNLGLLITAQTLDGEPVPDGIMRFAKRHHNLLNRQPLLVLFVDDGRHSHKKYHQAKISDYHTYGFKDWANPNNTQQNVQNMDEELVEQRLKQNVQISRTQRAVSNVLNDGKQSHSQSCTRHDLYVDFEKIGWSAWIISPKGYNAYYCKGHCAFPLGQTQWPTNHATVQSIVYELKLTQGVTLPCCVPNKLYPISLLYFDEHGNVILKQYDDMVASSCGCH